MSWLCVEWSSRIGLPPWGWIRQQQQQKCQLQNDRNYLFAAHRHYLIPTCASLRLSLAVTSALNMANSAIHELSQQIKPQDYPRRSACSRVKAKDTPTGSRKLNQDLASERESLLPLFSTWEQHFRLLNKVADWSNDFGLRHHFELAHLNTCPTIRLGDSPFRFGSPAPDRCRRQWMKSKAARTAKLLSRLWSANTWLGFTSLYLTCVRHSSPSSSPNRHNSHTHTVKHYTISQSENLPTSSYLLHSFNQHEQWKHNNNSPVHKSCALMGKLVREQSC